MPHTHATAERRVRVWDPFVRAFHWSLVGLFALAYLSGDEESRLHVNAGYVIIGLVAARVVWGLVGPRYARFRHFVHGPGTVRAYARDYLAGRARRYLGHNPLGGAMVVALLASVLLTALTGLGMQQLDENARLSAFSTPTLIAAARADDHRGSAHEALEETHEFLANFTLLLIALHVAGVLAGSLLHRENLVRAMLTGDKRPLTEGESS
jgi:cytochrome b